jgi:hypothetical protein
MQKGNSMTENMPEKQAPGGEREMKRRGSYDFYLVLATALVLFVISLISIYGMFYFKFAQIQQMGPAIKMSYMERMNVFVSPFIIMLILLLGVCVPKRLLPAAWLNRAALLLAACGVLTGFVAGTRTSLIVILGASLVLQLSVLAMALAGSKNLHFHKKGYWVRLGSSLMHLGLILFVFDLLLHERKNLHLLLFWITTGATVAGMVFCFYADAVAGFLGARQEPSSENNT